MFKKNKDKGFDNFEEMERSLSQEIETAKSNLENISDQLEKAKEKNRIALLESKLNKLVEQRLLEEKTKNDMASKKSPDDWSDFYTKQEEEYRYWLNIKLELLNNYDYLTDYENSFEMRKDQHVKTGENPEMINAILSCNSSLYNIKRLYMKYNGKSEVLDKIEEEVINSRKGL